MKFLSKEKISNHRYKTPEGYLVCLDAIIARTGKQDYSKSELFSDSDDDSVISIDRPLKEVFSPQTIASFENKPFVDEHPNEDVNVDNHRDYAIGFVRDVRSTYIDEEPVLIANLVVTDPEAIAEIESGKKTELSCGYDCDILGKEPNLYQANIRGNHVALCKAGRAGIARIVDSDSIKDELILDDNYDNLERYLKKYNLDNYTYSVYKESTRYSLTTFKRFAKINGGVFNKIDLNKVWNISNGRSKDSIMEDEEMINDKNLGQSFLKVGQKVHLDPTKNKRLDKEDLDAEYEILGFWYDGKLVTKDPVSKQEFLDMSGVRIKNTTTGQKLSVNRFQLMDSIEDEEINDRPDLETNSGKQDYYEQQMKAALSIINYRKWNSKGSKVNIDNNTISLTASPNGITIYNSNTNEKKLVKSQKEVEEYLKKNVKDSIMEDEEMINDSDKLKRLAYKLAQMGNYFDRANSANSRNILAREDDTKIVEFYKLGLEVYEQLKQEVEYLRQNKKAGSNWYTDSEIYDLLLDGSERLYWTREPKCVLLSKKINELLKEYKRYSYKDSKTLDSVKITKLIRIYKNVKDNKVKDKDYEAIVEKALKKHNIKMDDINYIEETFGGVEVECVNSNIKRKVKEVLEKEFGWAKNRGSFAVLVEYDDID